MIVARDDGLIEVYAYQHNSPYAVLCYQNQVKSTITGIDFGHITMANSNDIIVSCFDGKIIALVDSKKFRK